MKKRLLSMLMAVLMIVSLVPAVSAAADATTVIDIKADATAKQPGIKVTTVDYSTYTVEIKAFAKMADICEKHTPVTNELLATTCNQAGLTVTYCSACGTDLNKNVVTSKLHHDCTFTVVVAPTCDVDGWGYAVCNKCGTPAPIDVSSDFETYIEQGKAELDAAYAKRVDDVEKLFAAAGHDYAVVTADIVDDDGKVLAYAGKEATHVAMLEGYDITYQWVDGAYISAHANDLAGLIAAGKVVAVDGMGYTAGVACTKCGAVENAGSFIEALNGTHAAYMTVLDAGKRPVVYADGSYKDGVTATYFCSKCNKTFGGEVLSAVKWFNLVETVDAKIGDVKIYEGETVYKLNAAGTAVEVIPATDLHKAVAPTCQWAGNTGDVIVYTASGVADKDTGKVPAVWMLKENGEELEQLDHHYVAMPDKDATCTEDGVHYVGVNYCDNVVGKNPNGTDKLCGDLKYDVVNNYQNSLVAKGHVAKEVVLVEDTCQHAGLNVVQCTVCGDYLSASYPYDTAVAGVAPAYTVDKVKKCVAADELANVVEATCTEAGYTGDKVCKWCGDVLVKGEATEALGHTEEAVEAVAATCTEAGLTAGTKCSVCGEVIVAQEEVPALGHKFENGFCTVCEAADPDYVAPVEPVAPEFTDVDAISEWAGEAVAWAAANGVVNGRDDGSFDPQADVTRAEVAVMLYRLAGEPEVADTALAFADAADVPDWAVKAVAWAVSEGVVNGYTDNTLKANANITRAEFVQMLFNMKGAKVESVATFSDVAAGEWYVDAINWAVENGVTEGMGDGSFGVAANCSREQAVTFLFRLFAE